MPKALLLMVWNWILANLKLPDPHDGASVRKWLQTLLAFVAPAIDMIPYARVKMGYEMLEAMLKCDECWAKVWALVESLLGDENKIAVFTADGTVAATASGPLFADLVQTAQEKVDLNVNDLWVLIQTLVKFVEGLRQ